jgi:pyridinium-3,5-bisthiocarboxylic acid mononucleotide nickel chelatase
MSRIGWLDCSCGVSGDMLLGALDELGALGDLPGLLDSLADLRVSVRREPTTRGQLSATAVTVSAAGEPARRGLAEILEIVARAAVPQAVRERATAVFRRLADVEGAAHGIPPESVHFHEVGAVDSVVDVLGACLGLHALALDALVASPVALGGGTVDATHGTLPIPAPAVLGLLAGTTLVGVGGPVQVELATPTGVALLAEWATSSGPMPAITVEATGIGAGQRSLPDRANVVRLVVGTTVDDVGGEGSWQVVDANVDDLDPRLWPGVLERLLEAGAADAWLTPILMKKGRPAYTVSALVANDATAAVRAVLTSETSTIGTRQHAVAKHALDRSWLTVAVDGQDIRVKVAHDGERRTNVSPEFDDVAAAARALGVPAKEVLARATAAAVLALGG